jgi:hypothetical protein
MTTSEPLDLSQQMNNNTASSIHQQPIIEMNGNNNNEAVADALTNISVNKPQPLQAISNSTNALPTPPVMSNSTNVLIENNANKQNNQNGVNFNVKPLKPASLTSPGTTGSPVRANSDNKVPIQKIVRI